ncbi:hypothetical protein BDEG_21967 [Batrachochytrium dendrobatidis JEL423]|uniref:Uncharacterized protein n=1 Tax=Batrachochytrium dendrobatidis (strain JEL423) TaxID=403673 RepID=A0A177WD08_BATDL|nr:hypothetical protein BDEG_21967 [Batrachochytrium dendrobatidis JEL423]
MTEDATSQSYNIRPNYKQKFRPAVVSKEIHQILADRLTGVAYHPDTCSQWTREIADEIKNKLKVHVTMGEMRGEGVRMGARCFWDADTDNIAQDSFINASVNTTTLI